MHKNLSPFKGIGPSQLRLFLLYSLLVLCCYPLPVMAQTIPADRLTDWSRAGLIDSDMTILETINFSDYGGVGDGLTTNDLVFENLINDLSGGFTEVYFPKGVYLFNTSLQLPENILLKGEGSALTKLLFDLGGEDHLIRIEGEPGTQEMAIQEDALRGEESIEVLSGAEFMEGDFLILLDNDSTKVTSDWAIGSTGQLNRVNNVTGNVLHLDSPLRRDFYADNEGVVLKYHPIKNVGIENLSIERQDSTSNQTSNILFRYAANCWVKCVESVRCNFAHIDIRYSCHIDVSGSYFQEGFQYGGGGKAYGVMLHFASGDNLIYDNTFRQLRHAMILQAGANGNVFAYNYSIDPFWTEVDLPASAAGDMVLHGNYPYANLFEGNICQNIVIDDSHGINGHYNTFFRNRAEHYGIFMNFEEPTNYQNYIGNEISSTDSLGYYILFGYGHHEQANNHQGIKKPTESLIPSESTLFLDSIPLVFQNNNWPPIGYPRELDTYSIAAKDRFEAGVLTACGEMPDVSGAYAAGGVEELFLYPNPTSKKLFIQTVFSETITSIKVYSLSGKILLESTDQLEIDVRTLPDGIYLLQVALKDGDMRHGRFVKGF